MGKMRIAKRPIPQKTPSELAKLAALAVSLGFTGFDRFSLLNRHHYRHQQTSHAPELKKFVGLPISKFSVRGADSGPIPSTIAPAIYASGSFSSRASMVPTYPSQDIARKLFNRVG